MEYTEKIEKDISRVPEARIRKSIAPLIESMKTEVMVALKSNKVTVENVDIDKLVDSIAGHITKSIVTREDVHKTVNKAVDKFVSELPEPAEQIDIQLVIDPIVKAVETAKNVVVVPASSILEYRPHDQEEGSVYGFYGFLRPDGAWYIVRDDVKEKNQRYAAGSSGYDVAWKDRERLKYGYLSEVL